ncbi:MAG: chitobiase/beta-hexosaminidase C-terminal domain-containing protein, partial [Lentimicrobiaceae bacterium]|nr:chitobiase/beta-hexosaminidase C-terminal domain-containing protein [Lentimicrobiaceae bacterium]
MKKISSFKILTLSFLMMGAMVSNAVASDQLYLLDLNAQNSAFGAVNTYAPKSGTVNGVEWYISVGSCQSASAVWIGTNNANNYDNLTGLDKGLNGRGAAIAAALGISENATGYYAIAGMNDIANIEYINVQATATAGSVTSMWCLYSTNNGATYTILDGVKPNPGTNLVTFTALSIIENAQYAFVWYSSAYGNYRAPKFEFFGSNTSSLNHETFNTLTILAGSSSYNDNAQTGSTGYEWSWVNCQDGNKQNPPYTIESVTPVLRHPSSYIQATIIGGISGFSLDYKRAYTSTAQRIVEVYINNVLVGSGVNCGGDADLRTLEVSDLNISGSFTVRIELQGNGTTNAQTCIDNFKWSSYGEALPMVATPTFTPNGVLSTSPKTVTLACATEDAAIYYTINGDDPTPSSTLYTTPIDLNATGNYTIKAIGVKENYDNSAIASAVFSIKIFESGECDMLEDFEVMTGNGAYGGATVTLATGQWRIYGYTSMDDNDRRFDTRAVRLRGNSTADTLSNTNRVEMLFDNPNGIGTVSFHYASYSSHSGGIINLQYSTNQGVTWTNVGSSITVPGWIAGGNIMHEASFDVDIPEPVRIRITKNSQTGSTSVNIDNICITNYGSSNTVATPTFNPAGGNYINTVSVTLSCATEDAVIHYTTDGTDPTITSPVYSTAIQVSTTTTIKAIATKTGMDNSGIASATYTFPIEVSNIAAFKAANTVTSSTWYKITGDVTFVYRTGRYFYVKDATGGMTVYDNATPVITNTYNNGDIISGGITGTCSMYSGLCEFVPVANFATGTTGTSVEPITLTMENLLANFADYESQLVKLEEVTFDEGIFTQSGATANINIQQNSNTMICRNNYGNITGYETNSTSLYNVTGFAVPYNADRQIAPRDVNDIYEIEYTVTFLNWNNSIVSEKTDYHYGDPVVVPANPTRPANNTWQFTFAGWNPEVEPIVYEDATYIATYDSAKIVYTITVIASPTAGGTVAGGGNFYYGDPATISATANPGYTFTTWNDGNTDASRTITVTETTTYTATFTPNTYTLTLNSGGGTGAPASISVTYNQQIGSELPTPTRPGYTFGGWFIGTTAITATTIWTYTSN